MSDTRAPQQPAWPEAFDENDYTSAYENGWNACLRICRSRFAAPAAQQPAPDPLRDLWLEWLDGAYDGPDLLRRVKLAVYGPLRAPAHPLPTAGVLTPPPHPESQTMTWSALELAAIRAYGERCWCAGRSCK